MIEWDFKSFLKIKKKVSLWTVDLSPNMPFEPRLLCESENLEGQVTEIKVKKCLIHLQFIQGLTI